jgi:hypothetical protein
MAIGDIMIRGGADPHIRQARYPDRSGVDFAAPQIA